MSSTSSTTDDVVVRLRLADVAKFVADVKAGRLSLDELERKIKTTGRVAKAESGEYGGLGLWGATVGRVKYAVAGLGLVAGGGAVALTKFAITSTARLEQVRIGFQQLLGSKGAADTMIGTLQDFAKATPFNFQDVTQLTQKLLAFGAPAAQVKDDLTAIGNAVSAFGGSSADMDGVVTALGQIAMKGHLAGQEVLQLNNHMINAKKYLMESLHVSGAQLEKMQASGKLSSSVAIPIILAGMQHDFGGMMDVQSHTMSGLASNLFDSFQQELVSRVNPFVPAIKAWLQDLLDHMPQIGRVLGGIIGGAVDMADKAGHFAVSVGAKLSSGDSVGAGRQTGSLIPSLVKGLLGGGDTYDTGANVGRAAVGFVWGFIEGILDPSAWWDVLKKHWFGMSLTVLTFITGGTTGIFAKAAKFLDKVPLLGKLLTPMLRGADKFGKGLAKPFEKMGRAVFHSIERVFPDAAVSIWVFFTRIGEWFGRAPGRISGRLQGAGRAVLDWMVKGIGTGVGKVGSFIADQFINPIRTFYAVTLAPLIAVALAAVKGPFEAFWNWLKAGFYGTINAFIDGINSVTSVDVLGQSIGPRIAHVGGLADGGTTTSPSLKWVGERGPELLNLPRGSNVIPLPRVGEFTGAGGGRPIHTHVYLDRREIALAVHAGSDDMAALL